MSQNNIGYGPMIPFYPGFPTQPLVNNQVNVGRGFTIPIRMVDQAAYFANFDSTHNRLFENDKLNFTIVLDMYGLWQMVTESHMRFLYNFGVTSDLMMMATLDLILNHPGGLTYPAVCQYIDLDPLESTYDEFNAPDPMPNFHHQATNEFRDLCEKYSEFIFAMYTLIYPHVEQAFQQRFWGQNVNREDATITNLSIRDHNTTVIVDFVVGI